MPQHNDPGSGGGNQDSNSASSLRDSQPPVILPSSSEDEEEEEEEESDEEEGERQGHPDGYEPLPQDAPNLGQQHSDDDDDEEEEEEQEEGDEQQQQQHLSGSDDLVEESIRNWQREEASERAIVWATSQKETAAAEALAMDSEKVETIRSAMAKFSLPPSAIPKWAEEMSDADWNEMLRKKLELASKSS